MPDNSAQTQSAARHAVPRTLDALGGAAIFVAVTALAALRLELTGTNGIEWFPVYFGSLCGGIALLLLARVIEVSRVVLANDVLRTTGDARSGNHRPAIGTRADDCDTGLSRFERWVDRKAAG